MRLIADLGGTHCRFALADEHGNLSSIQTLKAAHYTTIDDAIAAYLAAQNIRPDSACLAVAGPTSRDAMQMTNLNWRSTEAQLNKRFGFNSTAFINDFEAIALSVPALEPAHFLALSGTAPAHTAVDLRHPVSILGPGTGLGVAQLIPCGNGVMAIATEGGHTSLQAGNRAEQSVFDYWREQGLPVSRESFLSGPGLLRLYRALCALNTNSCKAESADAVSDLAKQGDALAEQALGMFFELLGSAAGDQALACGSRGGIVLAGGILPKLRHQLLGSGFRDRFEAKPPMQDYLKAIPVSLIIHDNPGLLGAARYTFE